MSTTRVRFRMLLVDGDILVYTAGFSCETRWYQAPCKETGEVHIFKAKKDIKLFDPHLTDDDICVKQFAADEDMVAAKIDEYIASWRKSTKQKEIKVYLTDSDLRNNFRYKIYSDYKQNRSSKFCPKPLRYEFIRQYLTGKYGAETVSGIEADDMLGIMASTEYKGRSIIISKDKDLWQIPATHYNPYVGTKVVAKSPGGLTVKINEGAKDRKKTITGTGFIWFCAQMLTGDAVDNIIGLNRVGPVAAYKLLHECKTAPQAWDVIKKTYAKHDRDYSLNADLLWLMRDHGEHFDEKKIQPS